MTYDSQTRERSEDLFGALGDCFRSGRAVVTAFRRSATSLVRRACNAGLESAKAGGAPSLFFEGRLCTTKLMEARFNWGIGIAPLHAGAEAQARLAGMGCRFLWQAGHKTDAPGPAGSAEGHADRTA